jgi:hypothetical protein
MTFLESKQELARKLDVDYQNITYNGLFTDTDLGAWIQLGVIDAWDYADWPFTQGDKIFTTNSDGATNGYYDYPADIKVGSIYLLRVGGKEYRKLLFQDYQKYFEDYSTGQDRFWTEYKNFIFINKNAYTVGDSGDLFGKATAPTLTNTTDLLPFSPSSDNNEHNGNQAIVLLAQASGLESEKLQKSAEAVSVRTEALGILKALWKPFADQRSTLQSKNRPMFNVPDFFGGSMLPGSNNTPGRFNYLN